MITLPSREKLPCIQNKCRAVFAIQIWVLHESLGKEKKRRSITLRNLAD
jgi:hypothetical protein